MQWCVTDLYEVLDFAGIMYNGEYTLLSHWYSVVGVTLML